MPRCTWQPSLGQLCINFGFQKMGIVQARRKADMRKVLPPKLQDLISCCHQPLTSPVQPCLKGQYRWSSLHPYCGSILLGVHMLWSYWNCVKKAQMPQSTGEKRVESFDDLSENKGLENNPNPCNSRVPRTRLLRRPILNSQSGPDTPSVSITALYFQDSPTTIHQKGTLITNQVLGWPWKQKHTVT